jgi:DNA mismatch endonuclease (patch repair protein)
MDRLTPERRSWLMSRVSARNTSAELRVRRAAHALGLRYRVHRRDLPGTPDIVFPKYHIVVFVHGCFWHRHPGCKKATTPKSRSEFWRTKFDRNVERDTKAAADLNAAGWRVVVIWECETRSPVMLSFRLFEIFGLQEPPSSASREMTVNVGKIFERRL